jgi:4-hydroxy-2-oxoheptanedioate aldolase
VFIGPNDLLAQMGKTPRMETDDPEFVEALEHIRDTADRFGVAPGIHTANHEMCRRRLDQGFRFLAIASDIRLMVAGAQAEIAGVAAAGVAAGEVLRY